MSASAQMVTAVHVHEASHAAIAAALGIRVTAVTLDGVRVRSLRDADGSKRQAIVSISGPVGEIRFLGGMTLDDEAHAWGSWWRGDLANLLRHLDRAGGGSVAVVRAEAERLVGRHWDRIERVAQALARRGRLTGDQIEALIGFA